MKRGFVSRVVKPFITVLRHAAYRPATHKYPYERLEGFPRTRGRMMKPVEGRDLTYPAIDFLKCSFCGLCVEICPRDALEMQPVVELGSSEYRDLTYYPERMTQPEDIKKLLPELKYMLTPVASKEGLRYIRRRV